MMMAYGFTPEEVRELKKMTRKEVKGRKTAMLRMQQMQKMMEFEVKMREAARKREAEKQGWLASVKWW